jgi:ubiquinone/menaquinone biosynthesis C-methylase UbiE
MVSEKKPILNAGIDKSRIAEIYSRFASSYDFWARLAESKARARCLELAAIQDGESVLEVGVGTGIAFEEILRLNPTGRNEGIDLTEEMLEHAKAKANRTGIKNYRLRVGDAYDLDYADDAFDVVVNNYMFDLLPEEDFPKVLAEFKRVLRPGGRLTMANMTVGRRWFDSLWAVIYRVSPSWLGGCRGIYILPYIELAGFQDTRREFVSQMTFPSEVIYGIKPKGPESQTIHNKQVN